MSRRPRASGSRRAGWWAITAVTALGCTDGCLSAESAVVATVRFGASSARCARLVASWPGGERVSEPLARNDAGVRVALVRSESMPDQVSLHARGHEDSDCAGPVRDVSETVEVAFRPGEVTQVTLELGSVPEICSNGMDDDGNGARDCQDADCACDAGICAVSGRCEQPVELCGDGFDNDFDGFLDCTDPDCPGCDGGTCAPATGACIGEVCGNGVDDDQDGRLDCLDSECACTDGGFCDAGACFYRVENCLNGVDDDLDGRADCLDVDCLSERCGMPSRYCVADGGCVAPTTEVNCRDQRDDDGDGNTDCLDADCASRSCDDGVACTINDTCVGPSCTGSLRSCPPPPPCRLSGVCDQPDGGCSYAPIANGIPCDGGVCQSGTCAPAFTYPPSNFDPAQIPAGSIAPAQLVDCAATYDTTSGAKTGACFNPGPPHADGGTVLLAFRGFTVADGGSLRVTGNRPLILAIFGDAHVRGAIDVGASGADAGPGGDVFCSAGNGQEGGRQGQTGSGGGGAGFAMNGAPGGVGNGAPAGSQGQAEGARNLQPLRGGCRGGLGGNTGGLGGGGGGAVQLSASGLLRVTGRISAIGGGGRPGLAREEGGGGGGSGGGILLEGLRVEVFSSARVTANGGAGGGGANGGTAGSPGQDGPISGTTAAQGGAGGNGAGAGGNGGLGVTLPTQGGSPPTRGGGGGGGAVGRIHVRGVTCGLAPGSFSPPPYGNGAPGCPLP